MSMLRPLTVTPLPPVTHRKPERLVSMMVLPVLPWPRRAIGWLPALILMAQALPSSAWTV